MKVEYEFYIAPRNPDLPHYGGVSFQQFQRLAKEFPQFVEYGVFSTVLEEESTALTEVLEALRALGLHLPQDRSMILPSFSVVKKRIYDDDDYNQTKALYPTAISVRADCSLGREGPYVEDNRRLDQVDIPFGCLSPFGDVLAVSEKGRKCLQQYCLSGLEFRALSKRKSGVTTGYSGLHLLTSNHVMPSCQNKLFDDHGKIWEAAESRESTHGCHILDGLYSPPELVYRRTDLLSTDCAVTKEKIGNRETNSWQRLIVSQRFRTVLKELGFDCRYIPVRFI
jgi:hypothetical protein